MANCVPDFDPTTELGRSQLMQEELQRRANEARKRLDAR